MSPQNLPERIAAVRERVARAAAGAGRNAQSVTLLAVGKAQPPAWLAAAAGCGLQHFGESYLQEALPKIVLAPSFVITLVFVYGFIVWTAYLSFTNSKTFPSYVLTGPRAYQRLWNWTFESDPPSSRYHTG